MLPEYILNKIMLYNSHPIADIMKESSIFKYLQLREKTVSLNGCYNRDTETHTCIVACCDAHHRGKYGIKDYFVKWNRNTIAEYDVKKYIEIYNIGYQHTMRKTDNRDVSRNNKFNYSFKAVSEVDKDNLWAKRYYPQVYWTYLVNK